MRCLFVLSLVGLSPFGSVVIADEPPRVVAAEELPPIPEPVEEYSGVSANVADCTTDCSSGNVFSTFRSWWHYRAKPHLQTSHWGYPEYFNEPPFGISVRANLESQVLNGQISQLVLYEYDFFDAPGPRATELKPRGRDQLRRLVGLVKATGQPIVIEESAYGAELNQARRQAVFRQLEDLDIVSVPSELVVLGRVRVAGLGAAGERAFPDQSNRNTTYRNRLEQTLDRGSLRLLQGLSQ